MSDWGLLHSSKGINGQEVGFYIELVTNQQKHSIAGAA